MKKSHQRGKFLSWLPASLILAATVATVAGISLIPTVGAAPTATVTVNGTVTGTIDFTANCGSATFGSNFTSGGAGQVTPDCTMTFVTNQVTGGAVSVQDNDGAAPFFCTAGCAAASTTAFENGPAGPAPVDTGAANDDRFGFALKTISGGGTPISDATLDGTPTLAEVDWYPVLPGATPVCHAVTNTAGTSCTVVFGGEPGSPQNSGAYTGTALFTAVTT